MNHEIIAEIRDLSVVYHTEEDDVHALNGVSLKLYKGETLGLVGETGAGKTTTALSIMRLLPKRVGEITSGEIYFEGRDLLKCTEADMRAIRGAEISMIFQDPMTSLNPVLKVGEQIAESIRQHEPDMKKPQVEKRVEEILEMVGIPASRKNEYPHQFSGGMKQRVVIAIALALEPRLLLADEPTTALDVTIQAQVLQMMGDLQQKLGTSTILITHDLGVVSQNCDQRCRHVRGRGGRERHGKGDILRRKASSVYAGAVRQSAGSQPRDAQAFADRRSDAGYDAGAGGLQVCAALSALHGAMQDVPAAAERNGRPQHPLPSGEFGGRSMSQPLLETRHLKKYFKTPSGMLHAVDDVSLSIEEGQTLGVVGESGCGKSTLGRTVLRLLEPTSGEILYKGEDITKFDKKRMLDLRAQIQMIFQDPYASLNPRLSVSEIIAEPLIVSRNKISGAEREKRVLELMDTVGLARRTAGSYPHELDGGRRQRIGIARALATDPQFISSATSRFLRWMSPFRRRSSTC